MFTGIIEEIGKVRQITTNRIQIECKSVLKDVNIGDSIAVNGVCLTVTECKDGFFSADVSPETIRVTSFESVNSGDLVNLERAMPANGRFGGHIVSGHIDTTGRVLGINKDKNFYNFEFEVDYETAKYLVKKGSVAINGVSLTIAETDNNIIRCAIIPHTFENTNLKTLSYGDSVNIETDIIAKYIEKFLSTSDNKSRIDYDFLIENGFR